MGYRIVVAGATGNVGREMLNILAEREFPLDEIAAVASSRRARATMIDFGDTGRELKVQNIEHFDLDRLGHRAVRDRVRRRPRSTRRASPRPAAR